MWCADGDPATHIGYINQIILSGHLPAQLYYPTFHIYVSQIFLLSNIDIITLHKILPFIFGILYIPFINLLSKFVFSEKSEVLLSTIAGTTLVNGWYLNFIPNGLANLFFPLVFFIFLKLISSKSIRWELLILIIAFFYPLFHPVPVLALLIIIIISSLPNFAFFEMFNNKIAETKKNWLLGSKITLFTILLVWGITWLSSFYIWDRFITNIYTLITEGGPTHISSLTHEINYAQGFGYNVTEQILKTMGGPIIYSLITIMCFFIFIKGKDNERMEDNKRMHNFFILNSSFLFIWLFMIILYFTNSIFAPLRMITYSSMISTLFVGYLLNYLISKIKKNNLKIEHKRFFTFSFIVLALLLFLVWINGILTLYPSPYILETSYQTTLSEVDGMNWLFGAKNPNLEIIGMSLVPFRYAEFLLTPEQKQLQKLHYWEKPDDLTIPFHFGYDNDTVLSDYYNQNIYMGIDEKDKKIYADVFPKMAKIRWLPSDFEKLNKDISLEKIYSNKQFEIYYIKGLRSF